MGQDQGMQRSADRRVRRLRQRARAAGFDASLDDEVGDLLAVLAAAKPGGRFLELGTGAGVGTAYLVSGADAGSRLVTVELDADLSAVAQHEISDVRVRWVVGDGGPWLEHPDRAAEAFDLIFADTWPGKFTHLDQALALVAPGGCYVVDDLLPQPNWPQGHHRAVDRLITGLQDRPELITARLEWASGVMVCVRAG
jgi:predicted O-methyltransferase YrrM